MGGGCWGRLADINQGRSAGNSIPSNHLRAALIGGAIRFDVRPMDGKGLISAAVGFDILQCQIPWEENPSILADFSHE